MIDQTPNWPLTRLGNLAAPSSARTVPTTQDFRKYIGLENVESGSAKILGWKLAREMRSSAACFSAGDILYGRLRPYLNKICAPSFEGLASGEFIVLRPLENVEPLFLLYRMLSLDFVSFASKYSDGDRPRVKWNQLAEFRIAIPDLYEQRRIVRFIEEQLSRLDAAQAALTGATRKLTAWRGAVGARLLDQRTWERAALGAISQVQGGIQKQPKRRPSRNSYPFLRVANVLRGRLDLTEIHQIELFGNEIDRYRLVAGDLLVVEGNGSASQIGRCALWHGEISDCVHQNHLIRIRPGPLVEPRFLELYWNMPLTISRLSGLASSTSGLYTLSTSKLKAFQIPLPPIQVQRQVIDDFEAHLAMELRTTDALVRAVSGLRRLRASILKHAFRGDLTEWSDIPDGKAHPFPLRSVSGAAP